MEKHECELCETILLVPDEDVRDHFGNVMVSVSKYFECPVCGENMHPKYNPAGYTSVDDAIRATDIQQVARKD